MTNRHAVGVEGEEGVGERTARQAAAFAGRLGAGEFRPVDLGLEAQVGRLALLALAPEQAQLGVV